MRAAYFRIVQRLGDSPPEPEEPAAAQQERLVAPAVGSALTARLFEVSHMDPQTCGYAFEKILKDVFDAYGMATRASLRHRGEQVDGSFVLDEQTYQLKARWRNAQVDGADLHAFNGKAEGKVSWSRGLIVSQSGFTAD